MGRWFRSARYVVRVWLSPLQKISLILYYIVVHGLTLSSDTMPCPFAVLEFDRLWISRLLFLSLIIIINKFIYRLIYRFIDKYGNLPLGRNRYKVYAFNFISNTFISNARLKFANFQNLSRKILRTELSDLCQMIALFPNSMLNTFLSGRVRPILGNFGFRWATSEPSPKKPLLIKKRVSDMWIFRPESTVQESTNTHMNLKCDLKKMPLFFIEWRENWK